MILHINENPKGDPLGKVGFILLVLWVVVLVLTPLAGPVLFIRRYSS